MVPRVLFMFSKHHMSSMALTSARVSVSNDITLPISPRLQKLQQTAAHHQKLFGFSLWSSDKCSSTTQLRNVNRTNTYTSLAKTPSSRVLSRARFSRTSFTCVCFSDTFLHASALALHLCPLQDITPSRVCPSQTPSNTAD